PPMKPAFRLGCLLYLPPPTKLAKYSVREHLPRTSAAFLTVPQPPSTLSTNATLKSFRSSRPIRLPRPVLILSKSNFPEATGWFPGSYRNLVITSSGLRKNEACPLTLCSTTWSVLCLPARWVCPSSLIGLRGPSHLVQKLKAR